MNIFTIIEIEKEKKIIEVYNFCESIIYMRMISHHNVITIKFLYNA
jgi:hypothetical protein